MGTTSRARVSIRTSAAEKDPLLRPHYIVYLSSKPSPFLFLSRPSSSSSSSFSPPSSIFSYTARLPFVFLCLGTSSCPFPYKADLNTCPLRRMTVNRSWDDHRDVLPTDEKKSGVTSLLR